MSSVSVEAAVVSWPSHFCGITLMEFLDNCQTDYLHFLEVLQANYSPLSKFPFCLCHPECFFCLWWWTLNRYPLCSAQSYWSLKRSTWAGGRKIPWTEEPGGLQSMGSLRVVHDWATSLSLFTFMHWRRNWQPTPVFLPGESQGRGSLMGCRPWGRTVLDTTEATQQRQRQRQCHKPRKIDIQISRKIQTIS